MNDIRERPAAGITTLDATIQPLVKDEGKERGIVETRQTATERESAGAQARLACAGAGAGGTAVPARLSRQLRRRVVGRCGSPRNYAERADSERTTASAISSAHASIPGQSRWSPKRPPNA